MLELAAKEAVFHFNKKHLQDPTIPMWVIKTKGESYYVNHVSCRIPWTTKETANNEHTKGSIKIKHCLIKIDDDNNAEIDKLTAADTVRLAGKQLGIRLITSSGAALRNTLNTLGMEHGPIKTDSGGCRTTWYITELYSEEDLAIFMLNWPGSNLRQLAANEPYYKFYDEEDGDLDDDEEDNEVYEDEFIDN